MTRCSRCGSRLYRDADNDLSCSLGCGNVVYATVALDVPGREPAMPQARCRAGHLKTPANTYIDPPTGHERCRVCKRRGESERMARKAVSG